MYVVGIEESNPLCQASERRMKDPNMPQSVIARLGVCRVSERPAEVTDGVRTKEDLVKPHCKVLWSWPWPSSCRFGAFSQPYEAFSTGAGSGECNCLNGQSVAVGTGRQKTETG